MSRPFSIARALGCYEHQMFQGYLDKDGYMEAEDGKLYRVSSDSAQFNTGMTDLDGEEIFTGDTLRKYNEPYITVEVEYLVEEGAFFIKHTESGVHYSNRYPDPTETRIDRTDIIYQRLTQRVADCYRIVAHMQDKEVPPIDEHDELFDPPPPTVEGADD